MSVETPPNGSGASPLGEHIQGLGLNSSSPLMRTVTQEIAAIELALSRGVSYKQIAAAICDAGGSANPKTLRECVYRVRKRRVQGSAPADPAASSDRLAGSASASSTVPAAHPAQALPISRTSQTKSASTQVRTPVTPQATPSSLFASPATDPEVITRIRSSMPDLDMLAWQFRESQRKASTAAAPARFPWTPSGGPLAEHQPTETGEHPT